MKDGGVFVEKNSSWENVLNYKCDIKKVTFIKRWLIWKNSGISALCEYSFLSDNIYPTYAVTKRELKDSGVKMKKQARETEEIGCIVLELWYCIWEQSNKF